MELTFSVSSGDISLRVFTAAYILNAAHAQAFELQGTDVAGLGPEAAPGPEPDVATQIAPLTIALNIKVPVINLSPSILLPIDARDCPVC